MADSNNLVPQRVIAGHATKMSRAMHDIVYDAVHDEIVIANVFAQAILTYRGGADGEEPPIRVLQGPRTQLQSMDFGIDVDPIHDELFVAEHDAITVFPRTANGDVSPIRIIRGPNTLFNRVARPRAMVVDPVHNVLVVSSAGRLLIFDRTAHGNGAPLRVIEGPHTGLGGNIMQLAIYPEKGFVVTVVGSGGGDEDGGTWDRNRERSGESSAGGGERLRGIAAWSVHDNGDVPPRWVLEGSQSRIQGSRITLNPNAKEVIISSGQEVDTYYFPEIF